MSYNKNYSRTGGHTKDERGDQSVFHNSQY